MTDGYMQEGVCSAGRYVIGEPQSGWDLPCSEVAIYVVDAGHGTEGQFCHGHLQELLADGMVPEALRQPECAAGVRIIHPHPYWARPCQARPLEVVVMKRIEGGHVPLWFCEGHFHEFRAMVGADKFTFQPLDT